MAGTPKGQSASYWVPDSEVAEYYNLWLAREAPDHVGCVAILPHEQVDRIDGKLRPTAEVLSFIRAHPEGVTACGETITHHWTTDDIPDHLEYEAWFQEQPRDTSRFLCPYDLRKVPAPMAPTVLHQLGSQHSHVVLSSSPEPGVRLLQLFVFPTVAQIPETLDGILGWSLRKDFVEIERPTRELSLTRAGEEVVQEWSERTTVDW